MTNRKFFRLNVSYFPPHYVITLYHVIERKGIFLEDVIVYIILIQINVNTKQITRKSSQFDFNDSFQIPFISLSPHDSIRRMSMSLLSLPSSLVSHRIVTFTSRRHFSLLGICHAVNQRLYSFNTIIIPFPFRSHHFDRNQIATNS